MSPDKIFSKVFLNCLWDLEKATDGAWYKTDSSDNRQVYIFDISKIINPEGIIARMIIIGKFKLTFSHLLQYSK